MSGESIGIVLGILTLVAGGLAAYYRGQATLAKELFAEMRAGDDKVRDDLRREAKERREDTDKRLDCIDADLEDHDHRLRELERLNLPPQRRRTP